MGCGSNIGQVAEMGREGGFRPLKLLEMSSAVDTNVAHGKVFLFGETKTQRKILECDFKTSSVKNIAVRTRIPIPKIHLDPIETFYEESQEIFNLGVYGSCMQPPFNKMLALFMQSNLIFVSGGCDYDHYNVKNEAFYYSIVEEPVKISSEMIHSSELSERTLYKPKYSKNKFQKMASMAHKRHSHTGTYSVKMKSILVFGGIGEDEKALVTCEVYNIWDNAWKELPSMKVARANAQCFQYGERVYVFGGRSSKQKLSKKIEVFLTESNQWDTLNFKLHRGIQEPLAFSLNPNEILILGGRGHFSNYKSVIKVDLKNQTYIWESELGNEYASIKGLHSKHEFFVFGGRKNTSEIYCHRRWKEGTLEHHRQIDLEEMEVFSFTKESLLVKTSEVEVPMEKPSEEEQVFFGNDVYPCLVYFSKGNGKIRKQAVPLALRLKSYMGVVEYEKGMFMLLGGSDHTEQKASRSCYFYDKMKSKAYEALKMSAKRLHFASICHKNYIYVFGGYDCSKKRPMAGCERFNLLIDKWQNLKELCRPRCKIQAVALDGDRIAIFGAASQDIQIYDTKRDSYEVFSPKTDLTGDMQLLSSEGEANSFYVLRKSEEGQFYQSKIELSHEKQVSKDEQISPKKEEHKAMEGATELEVSASPLKQNHIEKQDKLEDEEFSSELPKMREEEPVQLETQMIVVRGRDKYTSESGNVGDEDEEEECSIEKVSFDSNMIESIKRSTKLFIEERALEIEEERKRPKIDQPESQTVQALIVQEKPQKEPHAQQVENCPVEKSVYTVTDQLEEGRLVDWQSKHRSNVVKRFSQIFFLSQKSILTVNLQGKSYEEKGVNSEVEVKVQSLS